MDSLCKKILVLILALSITIPAFALEIVRQKNTATYVVFPLMKNDGTLITGAAGLDSELNYWANGSAPQASFTDCTNEATEIGSTGQYYLSITQAEMNHDYDIIQVKSSTTGAVTQTILIRTIAGVPANVATVTTGGNSIDVASTGEVGLDFSNIKDATGSHTLTNITIPTTTAVTNDVGITQAGADKVWGTTSRALTDKSGFALTQAFPSNFSSLSISATTGLVDITQTAADKVWGTAARTLTAGTNIALAKGTGITGFNDIAAADVWSVTTRQLTGTQSFNLTGNITGNLSGSVGSLTTNNDKTGYALTQTFPTNFSSLAITVGGAVTAGTVSDKTGYTASTVSDKTGYSLAADQAVNVTKFGGTTVTARDIGSSVLLSNGTGTGQVSLSSGTVTVGTNNDKTGYGLSSAAVQAIWDALTSNLTTAGSIGKKLADWVMTTIY
jgi:hypothetical protein